MKINVSLVSLAMLLLALWGCEENQVNRFPSTPELSEPLNQAYLNPKNAVLKWNACDDPDGDDIYYDVYLSTDNKNWQTIKDLRSTSLDVTNVYSLKSGTLYYWKVKSRQLVASNDYDNIDKIDGFSETRQFYTSAVMVSSQDVTASALKLNWIESADVERLEITYKPVDSNNQQPIKMDRGVKTLNLSGLTTGVKYTFYLKSFDSQGHEWVDSLSEMPLDPNLYLRDYDFNVYTQIKIGNQIWLKEELQTTHFYDGEKMQYSLRLKYTKDYIEHTIMTYYRIYFPGKTLLSHGFRAATNEDWKKLERYLGMPEEEMDGDNATRGVSAKVGWKLKSTTSWPYLGLTTGEEFGVDNDDPFGFNAKYYMRLAEITSVMFYRWDGSCFLSNDSIPTRRYIKYDSEGISKYSGSDLYPGLVRCVKDAE